jgi:hypothetical protein
MAVSLLPTASTAESRFPTVSGPSRVFALPAMPARRTISTALNLALLGLMVLTFATGWMASFQGLTEFGLHKYGSVAFLLVAGGHLGLHWRSLAAQLRRLVGLQRHAVIRDLRCTPVAGLRDDQAA